MTIKTLLTEKKDYTISYQNNTKTNAASGADLYWQGDQVG